MERAKRIGRLLAPALLPLLLTGCMLSASVDDLYALPQLPEEYTALSAQIAQIVAGGGEYTAPQAGTNLQSVQLVDLDGDGVEEAVAFFRNNSEERPLKIYIFRAVGDAYEQAATIEGSGSAILSIRYVDMNGDGVLEIAVSWRAGAELQAMAVYGLTDLEPHLLMDSPYARYEVVDLDGDDQLELVVLKNDEEESGGALAVYYDWDGGSLQPRSAARLSVSVAELQWMQVGALQDGETAVFVTGRAPGVDETTRAVTDILVHNGQDLVNIALSSDTGVSTEVFRFLGLQPTDINRDGATEVPMPADLPAITEIPYWKIYWRSYSADGTAERQAITYHNLTDSWYLLVPDGWKDHFTVQQENSATNQRSTTFYAVSGGRAAEELFTIYTLTGPSREVQAAKPGRQILRRQQPDTIYAVSFTEAYSDWRYAVEWEDFAKRFNVIVKQWGEN